MLMPSIFGENLFDDFMDGFPFGNYRNASSFGSLMKTDIRDTDQGYELDIDMPGFKKEDIRAELKNGYLTIEAESSQENQEKDEKGRYIRRERYSGSMSRSFYVGSRITEPDIHAKYENGILTLNIPKEDEKAIEKKRFIEIEG